MNDGASIGVVLTDWRAEEKLLYLLRLRVCMQHIAVLYTLQDRRTLHYTLFYRVLWRSPTRGPRNPPGGGGLQVYCMRSRNSHNFPVYFDPLASVWFVLSTCVFVIIIIIIIIVKNLILIH